MSNQPHQYIPTNDVYHELIVLLRIHREKDYLQALFARRGWDVTRAKLKAWATRSGSGSPGYRPMPTEALRDFMDVLKEERLISCPDDTPEERPDRRE